MFIILLATEKYRACPVLKVFLRFGQLALLEVEFTDVFMGPAGQRIVVKILALVG